MDDDGQIMPGKVSIANNEKSWRFDPKNPLTYKTLQLVIDARLEDIAGNNFRELLDHAVSTFVENVDHKTIFVTLRLAP